MKIKVIIDARWAKSKTIEVSIKDEDLLGLTEPQIQDLLEEEANRVFWEQVSFEWERVNEN